MSIGLSPTPHSPPSQISLRPTYRRIPGYALSCVDASRHQNARLPSVSAFLLCVVLVVVMVVIVVHLFFTNSLVLLSPRLFLLMPFTLLSQSLSLIVVLRIHIPPLLLLRAAANVELSMPKCQFTVDPKTADGAACDQMDDRPLKLTAGPQRRLFSPLSFKLSPFKLVAIWPLLPLPLVTL